MRRLLIAIGVLCLLAVGVFCHQELGFLAADGGFEVIVSVRSESGQQIKRVESCVSYGMPSEEVLSRERTLLVSDFAFLEGHGEVDIKDFQGQPFEVFLNCSGHYSGVLGRESFYHQDSCLVVIATYENGKRIGKAFDISGTRVSRSFTAIMP